MMQRLAVFAWLLALAGCASAPPRSASEKTPSTPTASYQAEPGRDAATVARMRASPAPVTPEMTPGNTPSGDHGRLIAQGFVLIGTGHFGGPEAAARADALQQGLRVGAERVLLYASPSAPDGGWTATYYVRFRLPFGATFRDLHPKERATLRVDGGVAIGTVIGGTPASRADLIAGDFVLKIDAKAIADRVAFQSLLKAHTGHAVTLTIVRNGETLQREVRLGAMMADGDR
jgi:membrane-associated protease RseP (regulator of RpoE activity)